MVSDSNLGDPLSTSFRTLILLVFGLVDDALVVGLSRLGCTIPMVKVLSPVIVGCTVLYLLIQLYRHGMPRLKTYWGILIAPRGCQ